MTIRTSVKEPAKRVGWMIAIWTISVIGLGIFAVTFRFIMSLAGLTE
ncbi:MULTISPECIES: DUF2474 domain-containing protein [Rhizobium/Agrobacterium group]|jgi:hypothetical protein|nr:MULTISPECIES: DUF2474 domain-containing protein [Rhizobium/Agrobacterium group]MDP9759173.1 hypothetical protein [Agrobacterium tumefaciens]MDQ1223601.1 hypothetical protein [Agrobacterium sp. SORGH_AS_0745]MDX8327338.1 DUF2474 domain-containing protein [Agrobacterium tumefaciens]QTQ85903.1 DUF2474 domain-containing protein [Agrobacterium tumefaciens]WCK68805.1 DUF2474 domain-containing protein [Agrobacterium tumefaciens]